MYGKAKGEGSFPIFDINGKRRAKSTNAETLIKESASVPIENLIIIDKTREEANREDCRLIQRGTEEEKKDAKSRLVSRNEGLITTLAKKYAHLADGQVEWDDILICANMGLLRAAETYDPDKAAFATYAGIWIRQCILRDVGRMKQAVYLPAHAQELFVQARRKYPAATPSEFYEAVRADESFTSFQKGTILNAANVYSIDSIDRPIGILEDDETSIGELYAADADVEEDAVNNVESEEMQKLVHNTLNEKEEWVVRRRFGFHDGKVWTLAECSAKYPWQNPITREAIRQIENRSVRKLRVAFTRSTQL